LVIYQDSSERVIGPSQTTHNTTLQDTDFRTLGGIRTRNSSKREASDQRVRPCCHRDQSAFRSGQ